MNIPEYFMYEAERMDNGETIQGYFFQIWSETHLLWGTTNGSPNMIQVKPETVRRVKMPVKHERTCVGDYRCPNCNAAFIEGLETTPFCGNCGVGLEWEEIK